MKLISFILVICYIHKLVFANECKCNDLVPNCNQLPQCGKAILRDVNSCKIKPDEETIAECNKIHFSENLNNDLKCPDGTKAWPLMFIWNMGYNLFAPDGIERYVYTINNRFPLPTIHAIKGDWVLIPVINNIKKPVKGKDGNFVPELTTIHWHGVTMKSVDRHTKRNHSEPPGTPFMDGVPGINQCPIPGYDNPGKNRLDYFFQFVDSGTFWYHSHYEMQIADGLFGSIVVKDCDDINRVKNLNDYGLTYDEEDDWNNNIISVSDWFHKNATDNDTYDTAEEAFETYRYATEGSSIKDPDNPKIAYKIPLEPIPNSGLINGVGDTNFTIRFVKGKTYRLRLINMSAMTLFTFSIDNHTFEIIEVEGMLVKRNDNEFKNNFTNLTINSGQRYSVLVNANQEIGSYWMRFYTKGCYRIRRNSREIAGVVLYDNAPPGSKPIPRDVKVIKTTSCMDLPTNALIPYCDDTYTPFCEPPPPRNGSIYNMTIILDVWPFNISKIDDNDPWTQNTVGYLSPGLKGPYWDHKWSNIKNNTFLEVLKLNKTSDPKRWDITLNAYNLNEEKVHDIYFNNIDELEHPIHLHGHFFYVLGFGTNSSNIILNEINPIQRDTITVPPRGWAQIRFVVDNPGVWPMHCHVDWHMGVGMLAQFVELGRSDVAKIFTEDNNKPPKEWCEACENAKGYCPNWN